jgi:hypothetical protein
MKPTFDQMCAVAARCGYGIDDYPNDPLDAQTPGDRKNPMRLLMKDDRGPCNYIDVFYEDGQLKLLNHVSARDRRLAVGHALADLFGARVEPDWRLH